MCWVRYGCYNQRHYVVLHLPGMVLRNEMRGGPLRTDPSVKIGMLGSSGIPLCGHRSLCHSVYNSSSDPDHAQAGSGSSLM